MQNFLKLLCALIFACAPFVEAKDAATFDGLELTIASYNMAFCRNTADYKLWQKRAPLLMPLLESLKADVCGAQEPYAFQVRELANASKKYKFAGELSGDESPDKFPSRPEKFTKAKILLHNMNNPVWYDAEKFGLLDSGKFWFSETPDIESGGFGEPRFDSVRNCVWAKLSAKSGGFTFFIFNVHLLCAKKNGDKNDAEARKSAELLVERIAKIAGNAPFVLTGDFNATDDFESLKILNASTVMKNARLCAKSLKTLDGRTFTGYDGSRNGGIIDHIFVSPKSDVKEFEIIEAERGGIYPSDHRPIVARIILK